MPDVKTPDEDIIDLTDLIEKGSDPSASLTPLAEEGSDDEHPEELKRPDGSNQDAGIAAIDALLSQMESQDDEPSISPEEASSAAHKVDPLEKLDMSTMDEVDNLLNSLNIPVQPNEEASPPPPDIPEDLDKAVNDLLNSVTEEPPAQDEQAGSTPDLDALLAQIDQPAEPAPQPAPEPTPPQPTQDAAPDLDDLPAQADPSEEPDAAFDRETDETAEPAASAAATDITAASLDAAEAPPAAVMPSNIMESPQESPVFETNSEIAERLQACEAALADVQNRIAELEKNARGSSLEDLLAEGTPLHDRFAALIASSVSAALKDMPNGVTAPELSERMQGITLIEKNMTARMDAVEDRLNALPPQLAEQVEKCVGTALAAMPAPAPLPDASLHGLETRLDALETQLGEKVENAVRETLKDAPSGITEEFLDTRMQEVYRAGKSAEARMDALENRLDDLEPRFNQQVEKAAASAAARILREEIANLLKD